MAITDYAPNLSYLGQSSRLLRKAEEAMSPDASNEYIKQMQGLYGGQGGSPLTGMGQGIYQYGRGMFDPMYNRMVGQSADMGQLAANRASTDTRMAFDKARAMKERELSGMGINPNSGRFAGLISKENLAGAAAEAGNMTRARAGAADQAFDRSSRLASLAQAPMAQGISAMEQGAAADERAKSMLASAYETTRPNANGLMALAGTNYDRLGTEQGLMQQNTLTARKQSEMDRQSGLAQQRAQQQAKMQAEMDAMLGRYSGGNPLNIYSTTYAGHPGMAQ